MPMSLSQLIFSIRLQRWTQLNVCWKVVSLGTLGFLGAPLSPSLSLPRFEVHTS